MTLKEALRALWRNIEAFAYALEHDESADLRFRLQRLERDVANLNAKRSV
jgi:hypothetical protein